MRRSSSSPSVYSNVEQSALVKQLISRIKLITRKLNFAFNGLDVKWSDDCKFLVRVLPACLTMAFVALVPDQETDLVNGNGSGSGDGPDCDGDDECEEDGEEDREESGAGRQKGNVPVFVPSGNGIAESSRTTTSSPATDAIDRAAGRKWATTKSPVVTLNYNSSIQISLNSVVILLIMSAIVAARTVNF